MKVILINGSPHKHGCTFTALSEVAAQLQKNGIESEIEWLGNEPIRSCTACNACARSGKCRCVYGTDAVNAVLDKMERCDGIIVGSPVHYAGPSGQVTSFLGRLFYSGSSTLQGKPAAAIVSCRRGGASSAYAALCKYFEMSNMPLVTSQYWNMVHGTTPEEVKKDAEGLQTLRVLADNMTWLLKNISAGHVGLPEREPRLRTNFIR